MKIDKKIIALPYKPDFIFLSYFKIRIEKHEGKN